MAIYANGSEFRTLNDPITVNGTTIKEGYFNGTKCYPDNEKVPKGRYVLKLTGHYQTMFMYREVAKYGDAGFFLGYKDTHFRPDKGSLFGDVDTTIVSQRPIAVYDEEFSYDGLKGDFLPGDTYEYEGSPDAEFFPSGKRIPTGHVDEFPTVKSKIGYSAATEGAHRDPVADCESITHVSYNISGTNFSKPCLIGMSGIDAYLPLEPQSMLTWHSIQQRFIAHDYHSDVSKPNELYVTELKTDGKTFGYRVDAMIPVLYRPYGAPAHAGTISWPMYVVTFTEIEYNNNPPVTSLTFATDPPTKEPTDEIKEYVPYEYGPLNP